MDFLFMLAVLFAAIGGVGFFAYRMGLQHGRQEAYLGVVDLIDAGMQHGLDRDNFDNQCVRTLGKVRQEASHRGLRFQ